MDKEKKLERLNELLENVERNIRRISPSIETIKAMLNSLSEEKCPNCDEYRIEICGCDRHLTEPPDREDKY